MQTSRRPPLSSVSDHAPRCAPTRRRGVLRCGALAIGAGGLLLAMLGCGNTRPIDGVSLDAVAYSEEPPRITVPIELCLPPELRMRQWNVLDHPFRIDLGPRAALHFERLVKHHFSEVEVTFDAACGGTTSLPWITGRIVSAHRELYQEVEDDTQYTAIVFETTLRTDTDEIIWQTTQDGVIGRPPALGGNALFAGWEKGSVIFFVIDLFAGMEEIPRFTQAKEDFGSALSRALQRTDRALVDATPMLDQRLRSEASAAADEAERPEPLPYSEPLAPLDPAEPDFPSDR